MDKKLAKFLREKSEELQTRAKDLLFSYQCEDEDENTEQLLEDAMNFVMDVKDLLHHLAVV